jgi:indolepyruvate ferredoxin oxidoreductase beta subunit
MGKKTETEKEMKNRTFNIVISGTGGQGLITLLQIIAEAALVEGLDVKTSELHGLSQRGGAVETHIRFGEKVYSPLVSSGSADLIIGLEILESLRAFSYANSKTMFLVNRFSLPFIGSLKEEEILRKLNKLVKGRKHVIAAAEICKKELGKEVVGGVYLLGYAAYNKLIPLKPASILTAITKVVPEKYLELNKKAFELAKK